MKTRFAPSPTGLMHFGNVRTALFNYLYAKKEQSDFILRIEDTDLARSTTEYSDKLIEDLLWLGIKYDGEITKQSTRSNIYKKYYQQLVEQNLAYPCFCTEQQLAISRKSMLSSGLPPRYSGHCRNLTIEEIEKKLADGLIPALRFKVPNNKKIEFTDLIKGKLSFNGNDLGDFIIRKQNGTPSFMFCNAIDDAKMGVTHALRGDDHLTNTPRQIIILQILQLPIPNYGHFPMINGLDGAPLSKRNGSESIQSFREQGYTPLAVLNYLARLGQYYKETKLLSMDELVSYFNINNINTSPARHDNTHLKHWQKESMLAITGEELWPLIKEHVGDLVPSKYNTQFSKLILPNILMPNEAKEWANAIFAENLPPLTEENKDILNNAGDDFFSTAKDFIQQNPNANIKELLNKLKETFNVKGKNLFMPIRVALTGMTHGPELEQILTLMGNKKATLRFEQAMHYTKTNKRCLS